MFLKKPMGPRAVTLPDGRKLTRGDLPAPDTSRWVASRKALVVEAVVYGLLTKSEAAEVWNLSEAELDEWISAHTMHGPKGLRTTALQKYRQPKGECA